MQERKMKSEKTWRAWYLKESSMHMWNSDFLGKL